MTQDEFLERVWREIIRSGADGKWIDSLIQKAAKKKATGSERLSALVRSMVDKGVRKQEIIELLELDRRDTIFTLLCMIEEDGVEGEAWEGIHEEFAMADPGPADAQTPSVLAGKIKDGKDSPALTLKQTHDIAFSPDGTRLVTAVGGKIWEVSTGKNLVRCETPPHTSHVAWSGSGKVIALQSTSGAIRLCSATTGRKIAQVKMSGEGSTMAFSPDGKFLAAGDWKGKLFTWSATDGKLLNKRDVGQMIRFVCATADEIAVIAGGEVVAFDHALKVERWRAKFGGVQETCLYLSGKNRRLIGWDRDRLVILALDTGKEICGAKLVLQDKGYPKQTTISSDGRLICVIHGEQFILLDSTLRELGRRSIEYANAAVFSPDSSWLGLASWSKGEVWSVERFSTSASSPPKLDGPARADAK